MKELLIALYFSFLARLNLQPLLDPKNRALLIPDNQLAVFSRKFVELAQLAI